MSYENFMPSSDQYNNPAPQEQDYASRLKEQTRAAAKQAKELGTDALKQQVKKRIWMWVAGIALAVAPYVLLGLLIIFVIIIVVATVTKIPGFEYILKGIEVISSTVDWVLGK